jgi:DNA adenine methylase
MQYFGGKWRLAPQLIALMPHHLTYVEPFGGGASVLLRKPRSRIEVYNDIEGEVVNLFRQLRDNPEDLIARLRFTPFAREEQMLTVELSDDPAEQARRTLVRSALTYRSAGSRHSLGGFAFDSNGSPKVRSWESLHDSLVAVAARMQGVMIECSDALQVIRQHDRPDTLFFVDPPYVHSTRTSSVRYEHDLPDHSKLLAKLTQLRGRVILTGYQCESYDEALVGWRKRIFSNHDTANNRRVEVAWLNFDPPNRVEAAA